jgi:hypothetical protein
MTLGGWALIAPAAARDGYEPLQQHATGRSSLSPAAGLGSFGNGISALSARPTSELERTEARKLQEASTSSGLAALSAPGFATLEVAPTPETRALMNTPSDMQAVSGALATLGSALTGENANLLGKDPAELRSEARQAPPSALLGSAVK